MFHYLNKCVEATCDFCKILDRLDMAEDTERKLYHPARPPAIPIMAEQKVKATEEVQSIRRDCSVYIKKVENIIRIEVRKLLESVEDFYGVLCGGGVAVCTDVSKLLCFAMEQYGLFCVVLRIFHRRYTALDIPNEKIEEVASKVSEVVAEFVEFAGKQTPLERDTIISKYIKAVLSTYEVFCSVGTLDYDSDRNFGVRIVLKKTLLTIIDMYSQICAKAESKYNTSFIAAIARTFPGSPAYNIGPMMEKDPTISSNLLYFVLDLYGSRLVTRSDFFVPLIRVIKPMNLVLLLERAVYYSQNTPWILRVISDALKDTDVEGTVRRPEFVKKYNSIALYYLSSSIDNEDKEAVCSTMMSIILEVYYPTKEKVAVDCTVIKETLGVMNLILYKIDGEIEEDIYMIFAKSLRFATKSFKKVEKRSSNALTRALFEFVTGDKEDTSSLRDAWIKSRCGPINNIYLSTMYDDEDLE